MLARGAACDTCRARKVKCDASRPFCTPCMKSARGDKEVAQAKCKYEGTSVAAAREAAAAAREAAQGANGPPAAKRKRKSQAAPPGDGADVQGIDGDVAAQAKRMRPDVPVGLPVPSPMPALDPSQPQLSRASPPTSTSASATEMWGDASRAASQLASADAGRASWPGGILLGEESFRQAPAPAPAAAIEGVPQEKVDGLENRVAELERALRRQAEVHAAQLAQQQQQQQQAQPAPVPTPSAPPASSSWYSGGALPHTRSPSFPYAPYNGGLTSSSSSGVNHPGSPFSSSLPPLSSFAQSPSLGSGFPSTPFPPPGQPLTPGAYPPIQLLPPLNSPRPMSSNDPTRRSLSALSAAAANVGINDEANGVSGAWASPLSSLRGTADGFGLPGLNASPRAAMSSVRGTAAPSSANVSSVAAETPGSSGEGGTNSACASTNGTTPAGANVSPKEATALGSSAGVAGVGADASAYTLDEFSLTPELYALLHPQYPPSLPSLATLHHLMTVFFTRATVPATMLSRANLLSALSYGPADKRWPEESLLHAICAYAALYVSPESVDPLGGVPGVATGLGLEGLARGTGGGDAAEVLGRRSRYWEKEGDESPQAYHYRQAKRAIEESCRLETSTGRRNMLQVVQATILTCYTAYCRAHFTDMWLYAGLLTRLCTPLGLNHLDAWDFENNRCGPMGEDWGVRVRFVERAELLDTPQTVEEHWERATTFFFAFAVDRFASASTDWSTSIDEKDISTHLPCIATAPTPAVAIDPRTGHVPALSLSSPDFFGSTDAPIGSLGVYIKATVLLGRVINHLQRLPRSRCVKVGESCSAVKVMHKTHPSFVELDIALSKFKAAHSSSFSSAADDGFDGFMTSAYVLPHVATILLHEVFTDRYDREPTSSLARCTAAAKCVVNAMFVLYQSNYDMGGCDPFLGFAWSVTGRALVRDYATRRAWGQLDEAEASRALAESCVSFHEKCAKAGRSMGIASTLAAALRQHLDNPNALLPLDGTEEWPSARWSATPY
ncbi:uncharacterized protein JCM10292_006506 [Rhodotorula paludigena]|uniref:uncharacterized protein n=1 Tax=Rhodotorula paludigena TaxID=86838 RepID=UPI003177A271